MNEHDRLFALPMPERQRRRTPFVARLTLWSNRLTVAATVMAALFILAPAALSIGGY